MHTVVGEFCTARAHPALPALRKQAAEAARSHKPLDVDLSAVKLMSVSFLDEWLGDLVGELGVAEVLRWIRFRPALAPEYVQQLERSAVMRAPPFRK